LTASQHVEKITPRHHGAGASTGTGNIQLVLAGPGSDRRGARRISDHAAAMAVGAGAEIGRVLPEQGEVGGIDLKIEAMSL
jgi:hypothetical protein